MKRLPVMKLQEEATPYSAIAELVAKRLAQSKTEKLALRAAKLTVWDAFKDAIRVARENGHNEHTMRAGLEIACVQAGIPAGSFRSYIVTIEALAGEAFTGALTPQQVSDMSVSEARHRYKDEAARYLSEAKKKLLTVLKGWDLKEVNFLLDIAIKMDTDTAKAKVLQDRPLQAYTGPERRKAA